MNFNANEDEDDLYVEGPPPSPTPKPEDQHPESEVDHNKEDTSNFGGSPMNPTTSFFAQPGILAGNF